MRRLSLGAGTRARSRGDTPAAPLEEILDGVVRVRLVKVDVEGLSAEVLASGERFSSSALSRCAESLTRRAMRNGSCVSRYARPERELQDRGVVRTANNPIGDIAEHLVALHYGGERGSFGQAGWDVRASTERLQVKALRRIPGRRRSNLSPVRSTDYDAVIVVVFDEQLRVEGAWRIPPETVEARFPHNEHVNGRIIRLSGGLLEEMEPLDGFSDASLDQWSGSSG